MPTEEVIMVVVDCQEIDDDDPFNVQALGSDTSTFEEEDSFQGEMGMTAPNIYVVSRKGHLGKAAPPNTDEVRHAVSASLPKYCFPYFIRAPFAGMLTLVPPNPKTMKDVVGARLPNCILINPQEYNIPSATMVFDNCNLGSFAMTVDDLADVLLSAASSLDLVIFLNVGMTGVAQRVASCLPNAHCLAWDWDPSETPGQRLQWGLGLPHRMRLVRIVLKYLMYRPCLGEALDFANLYLDVTRAHTFDRHGTCKNPELYAPRISSKLKRESEVDFKRRTTHLRTLWRMCIAHQNPCVILPIRFLYDAIERLNITSLADAQAHAGHLFKKKSNAWRRSADNQHPPKVFDFQDARPFVSRARLEKYHLKSYSTALDKFKEAMDHAVACRDQRRRPKLPSHIPNFV